jgi:hypothetical protein
MISKTTLEKEFFFVLGSFFLNWDFVSNSFKNGSSEMEFFFAWNRSHGYRKSRNVCWFQKCKRTLVTKCSRHKCRTIPIFYVRSNSDKPTATIVTQLFLFFLLIHGGTSAISNTYVQFISGKRCVAKYTAAIDWCNSNILLPLYYKYGLTPTCQFLMKDAHFLLLLYV